MSMWCILKEYKKTRKDDIKDADCEEKRQRVEAKELERQQNLPEKNRAEERDLRQNRAQGEEQKKL